MTLIFKHLGVDRERGEYRAIGNCQLGVTSVTSVTPPLEDDLYLWAVEHHTEAAEAIFDSNDRGFILRCLGAIARRRARMDLAWLWGVARDDPDGVLRLSPYIKSIDDIGAFGPIPGPRGWKAWLRDLEFISAMEAA